MNTESIVYLLRKTSLTLEAIGKLTPIQFNAILSETYFQESQDEWRTQHSVALIMAAICNTIPRKKGSRPTKASDFLQSDMPSRTSKEDSLQDLANKYKVSLPGKELRDRQ